MNVCIFYLFVFYGKFKINIPIQTPKLTILCNKKTVAQFTNQHKFCVFNKYELVRRSILYY